MLCYMLAFELRTVMYMQPFLSTVLPDPSVQRMSRGDRGAS